MANANKNINSAVFNHLMDWVQMNGDQDKEDLFEGVILDTHDGDYDDLTPYQYHTGQDDTEILALFDYLHITHGSKECFLAYLGDGWTDLGELQVTGRKMGKMAWRYNYVYCSKRKVVMSVLRKFYCE